jgi:type IV pilus modification protein PilV
MEKTGMKSQEERLRRRGPDAYENDAGGRGFTLVETMVSLIIAMISVLGAVSLFTYAINYNSGASARAMALTLAQQRMEQMRSFAFADSELDPTDEIEVEHQVKSSNHEFMVAVHVCDGTNHADDLCEDDAGTVNCKASATLKAITIQVAPESPNAEWARDGVTVRAYRAASVMGYN